MRSFSCSSPALGDGVAVPPPPLFLQCLGLLFPLWLARHSCGGVSGRSWLAGRVCSAAIMCLVILKWPALHRGLRTICCSFVLGCWRDLHVHYAAWDGWAFRPLPAPRAILFASCFIGRLCSGAFRSSVHAFSGSRAGHTLKVSL